MVELKGLAWQGGRCERWLWPGRASGWWGHPGLTRGASGLGEDARMDFENWENPEGLGIAGIS